VLGKIDASPLRTADGAIIVDGPQRKLDEARKVYRQRYDRGYVLSMTGRDTEAQRILDSANAALLKAEQEYATARGR
jgi:outer membrane protein TolC